MNKNEIKVISQQEYFEIILNIDESRISIADLVKYLSDTDKLFKSINHTLNTKYSIGYDDVFIDVLALEKGSFKIPLFLKKVAKNQIFISASGTLLGGMVLNLLSNNSSPQTIQIQDKNIVIENKDLLENKTTLGSVTDIAKMAVETNGIKDISIIYEKEQGTREKVSIKKETLAQVIYDAPDVESTVVLQSNIILEIVSPVFMNTPSSWKVLYNGMKINAQMTDIDFLETMDAQKIAFAKGDVIVADLKSVVTITDTGTRTNYCIEKVHSYPKYTKIVKKGREEQPNLFDE